MREMSWKKYLGENILEWLLEDNNPSVKYRTLLGFLNKSSDNSEVIETQEEIMKTACIMSILKEQNPEGYWVNPDDMYNPKYRATTHNLLILAELRAIRTPEIEKAIEHIFEFQRNSGHFLIQRPKSEKGKDSVVKDGCCYDGNILYYLIHFGYLEDSRTQHLIKFQEEYYSDEEGGWKCRAYPIDPSKVFPENCYMGRIKMLRALASIPKKKQSKKINEIISKEVEVILENHVYKYLRNTDGTRKEKAGWMRFGFPLFYQSDILEVLNVLATLDVKDNRMQDSIDVVIKAQQKDGKWLLKNTFNGKTICNIEEKGKPSKWITYRALCALKGFY